MAITIGREQRDAIYGEVLVDLTGVGDVYLKLAEGDAEGARELRRRFEDDMRLLDDIGWEAEVDREWFELTMRAAQLARVVAQLTENARSTVREHVVEPLADSDLVLRAVTAQAAYGALLGQAVESVEADCGPAGLT